MKKLIAERDGSLRALHIELKEEILDYDGELGSDTYKNICQLLGLIASEYGILEANRTIIDFNLDELGWKVREM